MRSMGAPVLVALVALIATATPVLAFPSHPGSCTGCVVLMTSYPLSFRSQAASFLSSPCDS